MASNTIDEGTRMAVRRCIEVVVIALLLCFVGTVRADSPGPTTSEGVEESGSGDVSSSALLEIVASELELGVSDELISKGCRGCGRRGRRVLRRRHHHHGRGHHRGRGHGVAIGPLINNLVRNLVAPTGLPPTIVQSPIPGTDDGSSTSLYDNGSQTGTAPVPEATHSTPLHEKTPTVRSSSTELLDQEAGLEQTVSPPDTQETNQTPDQLLDQAQGLEQTGPPPTTHEETNSDPLGVEALKDMAEENTRKHAKETDNLAEPLLIATGGTNLPDEILNDAIEQLQQHPPTSLTEGVPLEPLPDDSDLETPTTAKPETTSDSEGETRNVQELTRILGELREARKRAFQEKKEMEEHERKQYLKRAEEFERMLKELRQNVILEQKIDQVLPGDLTKEERKRLTDMFHSLNPSKRDKAIEALKRIKAKDLEPVEDVLSLLPGSLRNPLLDFANTQLGDSKVWDTLANGKDDQKKALANQKLGELKKHMYKAIDRQAQEEKIKPSKSTDFYDAVLKAVTTPKQRVDLKKKAVDMFIAKAKGWINKSKKPRKK
jgi:hypothetical protein